MGLDVSNVPDTASFCSLHFEEKDLDRTSLACTRLRPGAFPLNVANNDTVNQEETDHSMIQHISDNKRKGMLIISLL